jgi:hypothetical protein
MEIALHLVLVVPAGGGGADSVRRRWHATIVPHAIRPPSGRCRPALQLALESRPQPRGVEVVVDGIGEQVQRGVEAGGNRAGE